MATNLLKIHVTALHAGAEKVFWYNYKDRDVGEEDPENYFGLRTCQNYPRPAYAACINMVKLLDGREAVSSAADENEYSHYKFASERKTVSVLWSNIPRLVQISDVADVPENDPSNLKVINIVGSEFTVTNNAVFTTSEPIYVVVDR